MNVKTVLEACSKAKKNIKEKSVSTPDSLFLQELSSIVDAGEELAEAAARVCRHYDGVHRLRLALSKWYLTRANEYGRGKQ